MKKLAIYTDASVIGGLEDPEFAEDSLALWKLFKEGAYSLILSEHTLRELLGAPDAVKKHLSEIPQEHIIVLTDTEESDDLADAYLEHGILGPGSRADALHVALATVSKSDVIVSWNFKHIVNLGKIRIFNGVNLEKGYLQIEIRSPKEVLQND